MSEAVEGSTPNEVEDRSYPVGRVVSIVLALFPFAVIGGFLLLMGQAKGWDALGYLIFMIFSIPFLLLFSIAAVITAFRKTRNARLEQTAKATSLVSVSLFGLASLYLLATVLPRMFG